MKSSGGRCESTMYKRRKPALPHDRAKSSSAPESKGEKRNSLPIIENLGVNTRILCSLGGGQPDIWIVTCEVSMSVWVNAP